MSRRVHRLGGIVFRFSLPLLGVSASLLACQGGAQRAAESAKATPPAPAPRAPAEKLPEPPAGFTWASYRNTFVLKPNGWYEHGAPDADTQGHYVMGAWATSPEEFSVSQQFLTGLTIQVVGSASRRYGVDAQKVAFAYLRPFYEARKEKPADVLIFSEREQPPFKQIVFRYRDAPEGQVPLIVHKFVAYSTELDTVHVFTFESPEARWEDDWKKFGAPMLGRVIIVPDMSANEGGR